MLVLRASGLSGDVILPSFTFSASAHAVVWNGLRPAFADIRPDDLLLDPAAVARSAGVRTSAILATHTYGTPCDTGALERLARRNGIRLFFDAAHAFGSRHGERMVGGFGDAEVFSLSPTKVLIAGEGGIIATNDDSLAERCRIGRDYGNPGDYDTRFVGLNARMSELHAATALASFEDLEERIARRNQLAERYRKVLAGLPGIDFPTVAEGDRSTYKDFTVLVDAGAFGIAADALAAALAAEGVQTRRYYSPPVHRQRAYRSLAPTNGSLPVTDQAAARALTLPLWTGMRDHEVDGVALAIARLAQRPALS
jgi:dTDP-4-amino-4,6-dideoxygalactose transaminase